LLKNAAAIGVTKPYQELRNPAHVLGACVNAIGEAFMLTEMTEFTDWVISKPPYAPEFIVAVSKSPTILAALFAQYLAKAASSTWDHSNSFAYAAPAMDIPLAAAISNKQAFTILAAIVHGAQWNGFGPQEIASNKFNSLPHLKMKAFNFAAGNVGPAEAILNAQKVEVNFTDFLAKYLS